MTVYADGHNFLFVSTRTSSTITVLRKTTMRKMAMAVAILTISVLLRFACSATEILMIGKPKRV